MVNLLKMELIFYFIVSTKQSTLLYEFYRLFYRKCYPCVKFIFGSKQKYYHLLILYLVIFESMSHLFVGVAEKFTLLQKMFSLLMNKMKTI